jgi:hypothetical protein
MFQNFLVYKVLTKIRFVSLTDEQINRFVLKYFFSYKPSSLFINTNLITDHLILTFTIIIITFNTFVNFKV